MSARSSSLLTRRVLALPMRASTGHALLAADLHTERKAKYQPNGGINGASQSDRKQSSGGAANDRRKRQYRPPTSPSVAKTSDFFTERKEGL
jgi:hypothetical protein